MPLLKCYCVKIFLTEDLKLSKQNCASEDDMITLHTVQPGAMIAVWKHSWKVFLEGCIGSTVILRGEGSASHPYGR